MKSTVSNVWISGKVIIHFTVNYLGYAPMYRDMLRLLVFNYMYMNILSKRTFHRVTLNTTILSPSEVNSAITLILMKCSNLIWMWTSFIIPSLSPMVNMFSWQKGESQIF